MSSYVYYIHPSINLLGVATQCLQTNLHTCIYDNSHIFLSFSRDERRWIEKQNKAARKEHKKEEMSRIRQVVGKILTANYGRNFTSETLYYN